jgi:hypothetical protein
MTTVFLYIFLVFASGCTPKTTVVLLPDPDGDIGHITVMTDVGSVDITRAGEASTISGANSLPSPPKLRRTGQKNPANELCINDNTRLTYIFYHY